MSIKHKRKDGYWLYYHLAHTVERDTVIGNIVYLVKENPPLCSKNVSSNTAEEEEEEEEENQYTHGRNLCVSVF